MIDYLIAEHHEVANKTHKSYNSKCTYNKSILEQVIEVWESIINHLQLEYDGNGTIKVKSDSNEYDFMGLSDGEKNIFYCIASVLLVEKNGYIIVDEPENHLNLALLNKLWDKIESVKKDCQFIYITHSPTFATGRTNVSIIWVKKYTSPANWEYKAIPNDILPQELIVELIGSKKPILFCEGTRESYDYQLYSILFKSFHVVPAGGHQKAIDYCKSFNENNDLFNNKAIAIIDKDFYDEEIIEWQEKEIYTLSVMEVENILCDQAILKHIKSKVHTKDDDYKLAKEAIFKEIEKSKEIKAMEYTIFKTNKVLSSIVGKAENLETLKSQINNQIEQLSPKNFYDDHINLLKEILESKDYDKALKHYNNKGMLGFVGDKILKGYKEKVIKFIQESEELQKAIIDKYFAHIPSM
jgi:hypothetical protein